MAKILGIGGVFFKCADHEGYRKWWSDHMGMKVSEWGSAEFKSDGEAFTMFSPFKADSDYFAPSEKDFMINLRVDDVAALIEKAKAGGAKIIGEVDKTEYGIFGWFIDPEGVKIELWQES